MHCADSGAGMMRVQVKEGEMTKTIYTHIMEQKYDKAVKILNQQLQFFPESRCALLLGCFPRLGFDVLRSNLGFHAGVLAGISTVPC